MIQDVAKKGLCLECGACSAVCPQGNISLSRIDLVYRPEVGDRCVQCGLCRKVCPGLGVDLKGLSKDCVSGRFDKYLGRFCGTYLGYSQDKRIRMASSSGGIITSICLYLLESRAVDGAVVVRSKDRNTNQVYVARNRRELMQSLQSKYLPTPVCTSFEEILNSGKKYVFVGSPCHIHALRKLQAVMPKARENVALAVAHFCEYSPDPHYVDFLAKKCGIEPDSIRKVKFREGRWPGNLTYFLKGNQKVVPFRRLFYPVTIPFARSRCLQCIDHSGELADICVGDAWCNNLSGKDGGWAVAITRNEHAQSVMREAASYVHVVPIDHHRVIASQQKPLELKKEGYILRKGAFLHAPDYQGYEEMYNTMSESKRHALGWENWLIFAAIRLRKMGLLRFVPKRLFDFLLERIFTKINIVCENNG